MTVLVRDFLPTDADAWARVRRETLPFLVTTAEQVTFDLSTAHPDRRYRPLVAEEDGEIIGIAQVGIAHDSPEPGPAFCDPCVRPDGTGRGAGSLLMRTAEEYLAREGTLVVYTRVLDEPAGRALAAKRGYAASRPAHFLHLDLAHYEDWLNTTWRRPSFDRALTSVVVVDGAVAAFSAAITDGLTRYASGMTGTRRAFRGRGLAKLAKSDSLHRARAAGYRDAYTANDAENGPMLAVNTWFGYRICATEVRHVHRLAQQQ